MNAVFERDYVAFSTSQRFLWLRFGFASLLGGYLLFRVLPSYFSREFTDVGVTLLEASAAIGGGLLLLVAPGAFGAVLVHARAANTMPVLLTTPLSAMGIAAGAFAARTALLLVFVLATWPPVALALVFGGVRGAQLFEVSAGLLGSMFLVAAPAFVVSAFARRTARAVVLGYLLAAALVGGLLVIGQHLATTEGDPWLAAALSPWHALVAACAARPPVGPIGVAPSYVLLVGSAILAAGAVLLAGWRLRRESRGDTFAAAVGRRRVARALVRENPILDRELRAGALLHRSSSSRGLLVLLLLTEAAYVVAAVVTGAPRSIALHLSVLGFQFALLTIAAAANGATALAAEHEGGTLDLIRVTPLTPKEIVVGKLYGVFLAVLPGIAVPLLHLVFGAVLGVFSPLAVPLVALAAVVTLGTWGLFALSQSLDQKDPHRAVLRTMSAMGIIGVLLTANVGVWIYGVFSGVDPYVRLTVAGAPNPVGMMLWAAAAMRTGGSDESMTNVAGPNPPDLAFAFIGGAVALALHCMAALWIYRRLFHTYKTRAGA